jgi:lipopolysaccharide transport system permease protein
MAASSLPVLNTGLIAGLRDLVRSRSLLFDLAQRDFQTRYLGSALGLTWAFIQPTVSILILWFVFEVGFRSGPVLTYPFILWMTCGTIIWNFFGEAWGAGTGCVLESAFLVRKVRFRVGLLPIVKLLSALVIHTFFIGVCIAMFAVYGYAPRWNYLQIAYYLTGCALLITGLSWLTSSLVLFYRDLSQIVGMVLQFGFWLTPIFWNIDRLPAHWKWVAYANPMYYVVRGYRDAFMGTNWFWDYPLETVYFWSVTGGIFLLGATVFRRLRPHFADVL